MGAPQCKRCVKRIVKHEGSKILARGVPEIPALGALCAAVLEPPSTL